MFTIHLTTVEEKHHVILSGAARYGIPDASRFEIHYWHLYTVDGVSWILELRLLQCTSIYNVFGGMLYYYLSWMKDIIYSN